MIMRNVRKVWRVCEAIHTAYHMAVLSSVTLEVDLMEKKVFLYFEQHRRCELCLQAVLDPYTDPVQC